MTLPADLVDQIFFGGGESVCLLALVADLVRKSYVSAIVLTLFRKLG